MSKVVRPVTVGITRYYRTYVTVDSDMGDNDIQNMVRDIVVENQGAHLDLDPEMEIEDSDITSIVIDYGYWEDAEE